MIDLRRYRANTARRFGSVGERLKNVATIDSTGNQIATAVGA